MNVKITHNDTGLDFHRIQKISDMFSKKVRTAAKEISSKNCGSTPKEADMERMYKHFGLTETTENLASINKKINELETQKSDLEKKIRNVTQTKDCCYGRYDRIEEGSAADIFFHPKNAESIKDSIERLMNDIQEPLWLAKDIDTAFIVYKDFSTRLEALSAQAKELA